MILIILSIILGLIILDILFMLYRLNFKGIKTVYQNVRKEHPPYCNNIKSKTNILIVGDSTATANGVKPEESIAGRLTKKYKACIINLGESGARTKGVIKQLDRVPKKKFKFILLMTGNNDIVRFTDLNVLEKQITQLMDNAKKKSKNVVILRGGNIGNFPFFPYIFSWIYTARARKVREIFSRISKEKGVTYVELWMERNKDIFLKDPDKYYTHDLIHLNGKGHKVWFDLLVKEIGKSK